MLGNTTTHENLISREFDITGIRNARKYNNAREFDITGIRNAWKYNNAREFDITGIRNERK